MSPEALSRCACCRRFEDEIQREDPGYTLISIENTVHLCTGCMKMYRRWRRARRKWYRLWLTKGKPTPPRVCKYLDEVRNSAWMPSRGSTYERLAKLARGE